jgi:hypothetical protein
MPTFFEISKCPFHLIHEQFSFTQDLNPVISLVTPKEHCILARILDPELIHQHFA